MVLKSLAFFLCCPNGGQSGVVTVSSLPSPSAQAGTHSSLSALLRGLPDSLYKQYSYELPHINSGAQLLHSPFFQSLISLACNLELDTLDACRDSMRWQWFHQYCTARRMCCALQRNATLPPPIARNIAEKVSLLKVAEEERDQTYLSPHVFSHEHDKQLVLWMQRWVWVCQEDVGVSGEGYGCQEGVDVSGEECGCQERSVGVRGGVWVCQAREVDVSGEGHVALCLLAGCTECPCSYQIR